MIGRQILFALMLSGICFSQEHKHQFLTYCSEDVIRISLDESTKEIAVPRGNGINIRLDSDPAQAAFSVRRGTKTLFTFRVPDLSSNANILWAPDRRAFAFNYSDGGAIGGFHVLVFLIDGEKVIDVSKAIRPAVDAFKARHFCKSRGNNVTAYKWLPDSSHLVLMTEVYPTGDCGPDLGHAEGYVIAIPEGKIERHMTLAELKAFPGICLENDHDR
jgi:hypothetical protein